MLDFLVASALLTVFLVIARTGLSVHLLWVPVLLGILVLLVIAFGLFLSAASLFFRDVKYIVEVLLTFAIFFTPVFYEVEMFGRWAPLLLLNPVAPLLEALNDCIVGNAPPSLGWVAYSAVFAVLSFLAAYIFFKKVEPAFAESI